MNILLIDEEFPYPLETGKRIRSFNLAMTLAHDHAVSYLAYGNAGSRPYEFLKENNITPYAVTSPPRKKEGFGFYVKLLLNLLSPLPYIVTSHYSSAFQEKLMGLVKAGGYDLIICEWTPYSIYIKDISKLPKIIVAHNIESAIWKRYEDQEKNRLKRWYISEQRKKIVTFEKECFRWGNGATAVSQQEAETIKETGVDYPVEVIENGVDVDYFSPRDTEVDRNLLVFTGSMDWRPNQDAAFYFVKDIFPRIRKQNPSMKLALVGRNPPKTIRDFSKEDGIAVTGTVDDIRPYIARGAVYVVPLRIGGGSRLKILEALAMKRPVVSTSIGAEGLNVTDGENIIISDGEKDFADSVIACLKDENLRENLAESGRKLVEEYYDWRKLGAKYNDYIISIVSS